MNELITVPEAARRAGRSRQWILRLCVEGRIEGAYKIGRHWVIPAGAKVQEVPPGRPLRTLEIPKSKGGKR